MQPSTRHPQLADCHYATLVLRLTLDKAGHVIQGELVDTTTMDTEQFLGVAGLNRVVQDWLTRQAQPKDEH